MKKVLIIEDEAAFSDQVKAKLAGTFQVEVCPDGQSGYYAIYEYKPDLVLLDLTIDQMDAVSLVGKMRVQKQFQKLPIFVLADTKTVLRANDAITAGANEAFLKDEEGTLDAVASAVNNLLNPSLIRKPGGMIEAAPALHPQAQLTVIPAHQAIPMTVPAIPMQAQGAVALTPSNHASHSHGSISPPTVHFPKAPSLTGSSPFAGKARNAIAKTTDSPLHRGLESFAVSPAQKFLDEYGRQAHSLRQYFIRFRTAAAGERADHLKEMLGTLEDLNIGATQAGLAGLARYLTVLEWRGQQLLESLGSPTTTTSLQGLATAVDILAALSNHLAELEPLNHLNPHAMVVDDENVSRKALCLGLEKAKIKTTGVDNPDAALLEAEAKPFDLIYLDVDLPKMNGFALCARLRIIPSHRKTPIIFVTSLNDVKSRASSRVSGGNDFITKPVNLSEVGINAWSLMIGKRVLDNGPKPRA